jgi:RNA polymerase sigma-70 factor (ECF subfamily)
MRSILNQEAAKSDYISEALDPPSEALDPSSYTDQQLVKKISTGNDQALAVLYSRFSKGIFNYALRLVRDHEAAEDVLQEVFVAVWQGADGFRQHSSVKTWIFRIAHYQAVNWLRRQRRLDSANDASPEFPEDPEEAMVVSWRADEVQSALDMLTPNHRATIELAFVHDLSYAEIAEVLDCPIGTVKSRMSHAIKQLGRILKAQGLEEL